MGLTVGQVVERLDVTVRSLHHYGRRTGVGRTARGQHYARRRPTATLIQGGVVGDGNLVGWLQDQVSEESIEGALRSCKGTRLHQHTPMA